MHTVIMQVLLWIGSIAYGVAAIPQIIYTLRKKEAKSVSWGMIGFYILGSTTFMLYSGMTRQWPMGVCNLMTFIGFSLLARYKVYPGKRI